MNDLKRRNGDASPTAPDWHLRGTAMSLERLPARRADEASGAISSQAGWLRAVGRRILSAFDACRVYYAAATMYDEMRGLSDAELNRRGLSRKTLARDICKACDCEPRNRSGM
jgi:hypothetical protein